MIPSTQLPLSRKISARTTRIAAAIVTQRSTGCRATPLAPKLMARSEHKRRRARKDVAARAVRGGSLRSKSAPTSSQKCEICGHAPRGRGLRGVPVGVLREGGRTRERAEVIGGLVQQEAADSALRIDRHLADGVDRQMIGVLVDAGDGEDLDRLGDVAEGVSPAGLVDDSVQIRDKRRRV